VRFVFSFFGRWNGMHRPPALSIPSIHPFTLTPINPAQLLTPHSTYSRFGGKPGGGRGGGRGSRTPLSPAARRFRMYATGAALAGGSAVWYSSREEIPFTHRMHAILVTTDMERQLGEQAFAQITQDAARKGSLLPRSHPATRAVERVGRRLAAVASDPRLGGGGYTDHMKGLDWEFVVIDDNQCNAFVVPGGKVVVFTGLLRILRSEKELAAVLAHEVAHVLARHVAERITRTQAASLAQTLAYAALGIPIPAGAFELALFLPNSRKAETEADVIGVRLAALACYDPSAAATVFAKLGEAEARAGGPQVPTFLRTHPVSESRVQRVKAELPAAMEFYSKAGCRAPRSAFRQFVDVLRGEEQEVPHPPPPHEVVREIAPGVFVLSDEE
jgi:metalloendopeptidase OMA1, mitochondrial